MPKTIFEYEGSLRGPNWPEATTASSDGSWSMTFRADGEVLHLRVEVPGTASLVDGERVAESAVSSLIEAVVASGGAASTVACLERPSCVSSGVVNDAGAGSMTAMLHGRGSLTGTLTGTISAAAVSSIASIASSGRLTPLRADFAEALRAPNPLVRFVRVYDHLAKIAGKGHTNLLQRQVDAFIRQHEPGVAMSTGGPRGPETVYTRLRNEIGHPAGRTRDLGELATEVGEQIGNLQKLVASLL